MVAYEGVCCCVSSPASLTSTDISDSKEFWKRITNFSNDVETFSNQAFLYDIVSSQFAVAYTVQEDIHDKQPIRSVSPTYAHLLERNMSASYSSPYWNRSTWNKPRLTVFRVDTS